MSSRWIPLLSSLIWGITPILNANAMEELGVPVLVVLCNIMFGVVALVACVAAGFTGTIVKAATKASARAWITLVAVATLNTVAQYMVLTNMRSHPTAIVVALSATSPLFTAIFAYVFLGQVLNGQAIAGLFAIIAGIIVLGTS